MFVRKKPAVECRYLGGSLCSSSIASGHAWRSSLYTITPSGGDLFPFLPPDGWATSRSVIFLCRPPPFLIPALLFPLLPLLFSLLS